VPRARLHGGTSRARTAQATRAALPWGGARTRAVRQDHPIPVVGASRCTSAVMDPRPERAAASVALARICFEQLCIEHVDAVPCQLECVLAFLWAWPRTAVEAVLVLRRGGEGTSAECVCARWRAAAARARPPSAPGLAVSSDGRRCFSAPPGEQCGWFWLQAIVMVQRVGEGALQDWETVAQRSRRNDFWTPSPWAGGDGRRLLSEYWMLEDLDALCEAAERTRGVLTVNMAVEFLRDRPAPTLCIGSVWRPCLVTLFSERLYMATHQVEAVELQLDMSICPRWIVMRGREPEERMSVSDLLLPCLGNGAVLVAGR
jgi:hypothetical protein